MVGAAAAEAEAEVAVAEAEAEGAGAEVESSFAGAEGGAGVDLSQTCVLNLSSEMVGVYVGEVMSACTNRSSGM